jgi:hypothetical protein
MTTLTFTIPPNLWLTSNRHSTNRGHRARIVLDLHQLAMASATVQKVKPLKGQVSLDWAVSYPKGVRLDKGEASNAQPTTKALLDGLVPIWLPDDGPKYVLAETFRRGPNLTVARLHEIALTITQEPA